MDGFLSYLDDPAFETLETILPGVLGRNVPFPRESRAPSILFVEDFDQKPPDPAHDAAEPEIIAPVFNEADIEAAREAGRQAGLVEARTEHRAVQAQLCGAAMTAIGDALAATREDAEAVARRVAEDLAGAMLALLQAALPAASEALAGSEVNALLGAILPALKREPNVELCLHPTTLSGIEADLNSIFPNHAGRLKLTGDANMAPADAVVSWRDGEARRDMASLWEELRVVLQPYALPGLQTILKGAEHEQ